MRPLIAIVGRPNVGKSSLFNRLVKKRIAVIAKEAGTTRDRIYQNIKLDDYEATLVDTGGIEYGKKENIESDMHLQSEIAIEEADIIYFVIDSIEGLTVDDYAAADMLRRSKKPILLLANKFDSKAAQDNIAEFYQLGFGEPIEMSVIHNTGIKELILSSIKAFKKLKIKPFKESAVEKSSTRISILGRPNVGKSSLVNALLGENRVIVSDVPGTTRDATKAYITYGDKHFTLIDTAGLRRRGKIEMGIEKFSSLRCFQALDDSDVAILMLDFGERIASQDMHIAQFILEAKKGLIIVVNKIDLAEDQAAKDKFVNVIQRKFNFLPWAPLILVSALKKKNILKIYDVAQEIMEERKKRISTGELNGFMKKITNKHIPSGTKRIKPKIFYVTQTGINPPEFVIFVNQTSSLHFSYRRYLENEIRKEYGFGGTVIDVVYRNRSEKD